MTTIDCVLLGYTLKVHIVFTQKGLA